MKDLRRRPHYLFYARGLILADGWTESNRVRLTQKIENRCILERVAKSLGGTVQAPRTLERFHGEFTDITANFGPNSYVRPEWKTESPEYMSAWEEREFFRGLFDGDGSWSNPDNGKSVRAMIAVAHHEPLVRDVVRGFCLRHHLAPRVGELSGCDRYDFTVAESVFLAEFLYQDCRIALPEKERRALSAL